MFLFLLFPFIDAIVPVAVVAVILAAIGACVYVFFRSTQTDSPAFFSNSLHTNRIKFILNMAE